MENKQQNSMSGLFPVIDDIPGEIRLPQPLYQRQILINGQLQDWDGPTHLVTSPVFVKHNKDGKAEPFMIGSYPLATEKEANDALEAALSAFDHGRGQWPSMYMQERVDCLEDFLVKMKAKREEVVRLLVWEIGKTVPDAEKEFDRTVEYIYETVKAASRLRNKNSAIICANDFIGHSTKVPFGVVLCMGPFNYPLNETFTTLIPALIMGNTILFKPPKHGTLLFAPLLDAFAESFPAGVVNTVYGRGRDIVPTLMESGKVDVLALIGSSKVADSLKKMHPKSNRLKAILGLDAKNAAIILADADLDNAVRESVAGALSFNGQRCTALKILFVHRDIVEEFNQRLIYAVNQLKVGMPWTKGVNITPLAEPAKPAYLKDVIGDALSHGAQVINRTDDEEDSFESIVKPAIVYPVNKNMRLYHEEQFGPVIPVVPFEDLDMPVSFISNSPYGQQVSIFSGDTKKIAYLIDTLNGEVGRININVQCQRGPDSFAFNGRKDSAAGTLSIDEALLAFSTDSVIATKQSDANSKIFETILAENQSKRLNSQSTVCPF
ncbi:Acyl-CoA reductase [Mucilaginibacter polytrichastri]|nr:aldehyde dehydrogenase family protein [Mucilaginibacter polytrichastri]SFT09449.1 Acyl-CoA reductase [Mucilaginibacter polytrichastri]